MYIPVYLVPALLVHRKALMNHKKAPDIARRVAMGAARSSLFLALYCTLCWRGACIGFQSTGRVFGSQCVSLVLCLVTCENAATCGCSSGWRAVHKLLQACANMHWHTVCGLGPRFCIDSTTATTLACCVCVTPRQPVANALLLQSISLLLFLLL